MYEPLHWIKSKDVQIWKRIGFLWALQSTCVKHITQYLHHGSCGKSEPTPNFHRCSFWRFYARFQFVLVLIQLASCLLWQSGFVLSSWAAFVSLSTIVTILINWRAAGWLETGGLVVQDFLSPCVLLQLLNCVALYGVYDTVLVYWLQIELCIRLSSL